MADKPDITPKSLCDEILAAHELVEKMISLEGTKVLHLQRSFEVRQAIDLLKTMQTPKAKSDSLQEWEK